MRKQPNLLYVFTDEQAAATMAAYGNHAIDTPNLDRLASQSVVFDHAYVTQSVCTPSRSTLMTGLYPHSNGCTENNKRLPLEVPCLPELGDFSDYATAYHGKWHLGDEIFQQISQIMPRPIMASGTWVMRSFSNTRSTSGSVSTMGTASTIVRAAIPTPTVPITSGLSLKGSSPTRWAGTATDPSAADSPPDCPRSIPNPFTWPTRPAVSYDRTEIGRSPWW